MSRMLELPEPIYEALVNVAKSSGLAPADWIAERLPRDMVPIPSGRQETPALDRLLRHAGSIDLGSPTGTENARIDEDLGLEYGDPHGVDH